MIIGCLSVLRNFKNVFKLYSYMCNCMYKGYFKYNNYILSLFC